MCFATTSFPCPSPNLEDLLRRLQYTRRVDPCQTVHERTGRPSECAGDLEVRHLHGGEEEPCDWCSSTAKAEYAKRRQQGQGKRSADDAELEGIDEHAGEEKRVKKAKLIDISQEEVVEEGDGGPHVAGVGKAAIATDKVPNVVVEPGMALNLTQLEDDTRKVDLDGKLTQGSETLNDIAISQQHSQKASNGLENVEGTGEPVENLVHEHSEVAPASEAISKGNLKETKEPKAPIEAADESSSPINLAETALNPQTKTTEGRSQYGRTGQTAQKQQISPSKVTAVARTVPPGGQLDWKSDMAQKGVQETPSSDHLRMLTEYEASERTSKKINDERIDATERLITLEKKYAEVLQEGQRHQIEIAMLKSASRGVEAEKASLKSERLDLETKVARFETKTVNLQTKNNELIGANEKMIKECGRLREKNLSMSSRFRGMQNEIVEQKQQSGILRSAEEGRKKQIEDLRLHISRLDQSVTIRKSQETKMEAEARDLRREMMTLVEECEQLKTGAARIQRMLGTPGPQVGSTASDKALESSEVAVGKIPKAET